MIPDIPQTNYEPLPQLFKADKTVVFDLMDHLRRAFEDFCNTYGKEVPYADAFMGVHNFHKLIIQDIARRSKLEGAEKEFLLRCAADTFSKAVDVIIAKDRRAPGENA